MKILVLEKDFIWKSIIFGKNFIINIKKLFIINIKKLFWKLFIFGRYLIWVASRKDKKIIMLMPYFGKWPVWMDLYIESCKLNPTINWLFFTDCGLPKNRAKNVKYVHMNLDEFNTLASSKLNIPVNIKKPITIKNSYKLCHFKPAYGLIFEDYLNGYDFWGHGDIDVIYGNIRKFVTNKILKFDVISFHSHMISGHFTLYRNRPRMNKKFTKIKNWQNKMMGTSYKNLDEVEMYKVVNKNTGYFKESYSTPYSVCPWKDGTFNFPTEWYWNKGKLTNNKDDSEYPYFHFMIWKGCRWSKNKNTWNQLDKSKKIVHFDFKKPISGFKITKEGFFKI